jgi:hypothetical protein
MKKGPFHGSRGNSGLAAVMISALVVVASGCASQTESYEDSTAGPQCPRNMTMKCYERTAQPAECSCVTQGNIEETFERIMQRGPN